MSTVVSSVNAADDIAEFLATRRAKITPEQVGLPSYGTRRVPGLRREEVASLAGVSADYYRRLERGQVSGVSELVLGALARALQLDDAERTHLFHLARAASPVAPARSRPARTRLRPVVRASDRPDRGTSGAKFARRGADRDRSRRRDPRRSTSRAGRARRSTRPDLRRGQPPGSRR